ncbi:MAG: type II glyceraldehyde-3-phosphate dehydrogenase [Dehalococcoidia bacterium]
MPEQIRVAVNGYGVIGKRVADAVRLQSDMELVGVSDRRPDYRIESGVVRGLPLFVSDAELIEDFRSAGIEPAGTLDDLLAQADVVVDCTPKGVPAANLPRYRAAGVKVIVQGGEAHAFAGHSFVAQANYAEALGREMTRVVSCNTTSVVRTLGALREAGLLARARGVLIRRATDPWESHESGIMDTLVPERHIPSHQGPDAKDVLPDLDVVTMAVKAAHTHGHLHYWFVEMTREATRDEVVEAFRRTPRIAFVRESDGIVALNSTQELMRDLGRPRGDMWEVALWEDILSVSGRELYYTYEVDNEAIVVPENIDAIRALMGTVTDAETSMRMTDESLGMAREFLRPLAERQVTRA